jgi:DNA-binding transcriptional MocR family regulator
LIIRSLRLFILNQLNMRSTTVTNLYQQIAQDIADAVNKGIYLPGDRVPSVRQLSFQLGVSISTVIQAYHLLEERGLVKARPQSGYYVSARTSLPQPTVSSPEIRPTLVSSSELAMRILQGSKDPDFVQLAAAVPGPELLPIRHLNRHLAALTRQYQTLGSGYDLPTGRRELRAQIAQLSQASGCRLGVDDLIITSGCQEALILCLRAVARAGDIIAVESPTYYGTLQAIEALGMQALEIPTHPQYGVCLDTLESTIHRWPIKACLFVLNFSNPLGSCMPEEHKHRLVTLLAYHQIPLIEDDIFGDLGFQLPRPKVCKAYDKQGLVMLCGSFSKTLAPGYRVGWTAPGRFAEKILHLKYLTNISTPTPNQLAVAFFLAKGGYQRHLARVRHIYERQMELMTRSICHYFPEETRVTQPAGGFVLWVELPEELDTVALFHQALVHKISIAPGVLFTAQKRYSNFLRINCAMPWDERTECALTTLGKLIRQQVK